jgi:hypothetical protein
MNIDRIGRIGNSGYDSRKSPVTSKSDSGQKADNVQLSPEAMVRIQETQMKEEVASITQKIMKSQDDPDRSQKIKEIKDKLKNGEYDHPSDEILKKAADRIADVFLG